MIQKDIFQEFAKDTWRLESFELKVEFEKCMSQQCHNTIQEFAKDTWRLESFELKVEFEKCMSQQCHNTITGLFMSQCVILTACREWFNTHLTTIDQPGLL